MRTVTLRLGLSLMVVASLWANRVAAQQVGHAPGAVLVVPITPYEPEHHPPIPAPLIGPDPPGLPKHNLQALANQHGYGCQGKTAWGYCGNFYYDLRFIFGSCRVFFDERCEPNRHHAESYRPR